MKSKILLIFCSICLIVACKSRNKLNTDEQKLSAQIIQEEEEKEALKLERQTSIKLKKGSAVMRLQEDRSVEGNKPPLLLDIPGTRSIIKSVNYSELGNSIRYVFLRHPNDSTFLKHGVRILFTQSNIIVSSWKGIGRFDKHGEFIEMICTDGKKFEIDEERGISWSNKEITDAYVGSQGPVSAIGDRLFYKYVDNTNKEAYLMEYNASTGTQSFLMPQQNEQEGMNGKGKIVANLAGGKSKGNITFLDNEHWFTNNRKFQSSKTGIFMTVYSLSGDTVCTMKDHDPVLNFGNSTYRGVESGDNYKLNGKLHIRQNFNDTVFYFQDANRLVPKYVINLGEKGVQSSREAISPKISLKDKFVYKGIVETNDFLFFNYTQDYACPNTARSGTLKYNRFVLNKKSGEMYHAYIDDAGIIPERGWPSPPQTNIINDLDFGPARWPTTVDENGNVYFQVSGKDLKKHVKENQSNPLLNNRHKLESLASKCSDDDVLLMIIE